MKGKDRQHEEESIQDTHLGGPNGDGANESQKRHDVPHTMGKPGLLGLIKGNMSRGAKDSAQPDGHPSERSERQGNKKQASRKGPLVPRMAQVIAPMIPKRSTVKAKAFLWVTWFAMFSRHLWKSIWSDGRI